MNKFAHSYRPRTFVSLHIEQITFLQSQFSKDLTHENGNAEILVACGLILVLKS